MFLILLLPWCSSDMTKGMQLYIKKIHSSNNLCFRVMSGIITGHYFQKYFDNPSALDLGTMVAVLEIGAFGG